MSSTTPQVGDTITTAEELDALPVRSIVANADGFGCYQRGTSGTWYAIGGGYVSSAPLAGATGSLTLIHDGHPPRPERVVAAQALREWADAWDATLVIDGVLGPDEVSIEAVHARRRADRIERGDA